MEKKEIQLDINALLENINSTKDKIHSRYYIAKEKNENINYFGKFVRWNYVDDYSFNRGSNETSSMGKWGFLHGSCDLFAKRLNQVYGYPIYSIYSNKDELVHAFCICEVDGFVFFIDVRGFTNDFNEFINEFYILKNEPQACRIYQGFKHPIDISDREDKIFRGFIDEILSDYESIGDYKQKNIIQAIEQTKFCNQRHF